MPVYDIEMTWYVEYVSSTPPACGIQATEEHKRTANRRLLLLKMLVVLSCPVVHGLIYRP